MSRISKIESQRVILKEVSNDFKHRIEDLNFQLSKEKEEKRQCFTFEEGEFHDREISTFETLIGELSSQKNSIDSRRGGLKKQIKGFKNMAKVFEHITRISFVDFDQSLCDSPENTVENRKLWEEKTGREWLHKDKKTGEYKQSWWYLIESLDHTVFDIELNEEIVGHLYERIDCMETYSALLTGRVPHFSKAVKEIMRKNGIPYLDNYFFNDVKDTEQFKVDMMSEMVEMLPNVKTVELFEDRVEHFDSFLKWGEAQKNIDFKLYEIKNGIIIKTHES